MSHNFFIAMLAVLGALVGLSFVRQEAPKTEPIRIGVLHSLNGTLAISEAPLVDAARLAVDEINARGGLLGRPLELVVADGRSDPPTFAKEAERLIGTEKVSVLFACWSSACRKAVKPVVEHRQHLLFYPVQYEGLEQSPNIIYTGAAPNQQIIPGTHWAMGQFGPRIFLVGSDYIFPRIANAIVHDLAAVNGGKIVGERYLSLGATEVDGIVADIKEKKPDVVLNTINGDSNRYFFDALQQAGLADLPLLSFSVAEVEAQTWGGTRLHQHYGVWSYFQSLPGEENQRFIAAFQARFGSDRFITDPMVSTYTGVQLWAQAVREEGSVDPLRINGPILLRQSLAGPSGVVAVDSATRHLWKRVLVGRIRADGQYEQVYASGALLRPSPWPFYRPRENWEKLEHDLSAGKTP